MNFVYYLSIYSQTRGILIHGSCFKRKIPHPYIICHCEHQHRIKYVVQVLNPTTDFPCELPVCSSETDWEELNTGSRKFNLRTRGSNDSLYNTVWFHVGLESLARIKRAIPAVQQIDCNDFSHLGECGSSSDFCLLFVATKRWSINLRREKLLISL